MGLDWRDGLHVIKLGFDGLGGSFGRNHFSRTRDRRGKSSGSEETTRMNRREEQNERENEEIWRERKERDWTNCTPRTGRVRFFGYGLKSVGEASRLLLYTHGYIFPPPYI